MNKNLRAGLLIILLAVPAFLFLFLKFFGENQFDLPYLFSPGTGNIEEYSQHDAYEFLSKPEGQDSIYIRLLDPNFSPTNHSILFLYEAEEDRNNHEEELKRISSKIENRPEISLFTIQNGGLRPEVSKLINNAYELRREKSMPKTMLFLIDDEKHFRGAYDPSFKSEIDRLVIEYQILLKF